VNQTAPLALKIAAALGLLFLHVPLLLIFVYAFTTEERAINGRRRGSPCNGSR
jgi:putative spermidine/putrescine transport system permease protein